MRTVYLDYTGVELNLPPPATLHTEELIQLLKRKVPGINVIIKRAHHYLIGLTKEKDRYYWIDSAGSVYETKLAKSHRYYKYLNKLPRNYKAG